MNTIKKFREKGITLIALVITLIILLILVGVSMSQIGEKNNLIMKAKQASDIYMNKQEDEKISMKQLEEKLGSDNQLDTDRFRKNCSKYINSGRF